MTGSGDIEITKRHGYNIQQYGEPVRTTHGDMVELYQSTSRPKHCWLRVFDDGHSATFKPVGEMRAHLSVENAVAIRDRLTAFIEGAQQ
ncbi:hypothetical protein BKG71_19325 [Mycobacteroides chelonae]|nr:hypothetical protein BKG71_19325 [Mycobacteroides chelonae]